MEAVQHAQSVEWVRVHPLVVRVTHWINAFAILIMVASRAGASTTPSPLFDFKFPDELTLGGWLAGALQWHFAAMWLLALNGLVYVAYGIVSGHFRRKLLPISAARRAARHPAGAARQARARRPLGLQRGAARRLSRRDRRCSPCSSCPGS